MTSFAVPVPQLLPDGGVDPDGVAIYLARAEALGFDSAWTQESVLGQAPVLDPLATLAFAAASSQSLRLGCAVFVSSLHDPIHLAKALASLDQLSRGRLEIGVAAGGPWAPTRAFGIDPDSRLGRFDEGLQLMKACWTERSVSFEGRFWQVADVTVEPKPHQRPHPPLWIGGSKPWALWRAAQHGNGFFGAGASTTADFAEQVVLVRRLLAEAGRTPSDFRIAKRVYLTLDDDAETARRLVDEGLQQIYGRSGLGAVAVAGTVADCVTGLQEVVDAGADLVQVHPLGGEMTDQVERLAAEVIPQLA